MNPIGLNPTPHRIETAQARPYEPMVRDFMTPAPFAIGRRQSLAAALKRMREEGIRHLPVLEAGRLAGVLSQRDAYLVESLPGVTADTNTVDDAMSTDVYAVPPDAPLREVAAAMMTHKYGCAVVAEGTHVLGVFTTVDALRALVASLGGEV